MNLTNEQKIAAVEARREYHRQWRAKNKDKVQRYNAEYWLRKAEETERARKSEGA